MKKILIATQNKNKIKEYEEILNKVGFKVISLADLVINDESPEDYRTFKENALQKVRFYFKLLKIPVICEDSGLEVQNLGGFPGIYSKRWMEESSYDTKVIELINKLNGQSSECQYISHIAFFDGKTEVSFEGVLKGELVKPKTTHGFGYDLGFWIREKQETLNNLSSEFKNTISHRRKALDKLLSWLEKHK